MNWSLIGMRGAGKSHWGRLWAEAVGAVFIDLDEEIERRSGRNIEDLVSEEGWRYFRDVENEVLKAVLDEHRDGTIISNGGGVIEGSDNRRMLREWGRILWVSVSLPELERRVAREGRRPSLTGADPVLELEKVFYARRELYEALADRIIEPENRDPQEVLHELEQLWKLFPADKLR